MGSKPILIKLGDSPPSRFTERDGDPGWYKVETWVDGYGWWNPSEGSQMLTGAIEGLELYPAGDELIIVNPGRARDTTDEVDIVARYAIWADRRKTGLFGVDLKGGIEPESWCFVFIVMQGGLTAAVLSASMEAPELEGGPFAFRRIGCARVTESGGFGKIVLPWDVAEHVPDKQDPGGA